MSKQDRGGVRTAQDLERKYDLGSLVEVKKAVKLQEEDINKTNTILEDFIKETTKDVEDLQSQIDGNITTHFYEGVPTLNNAPANEWTDFESHLGDLYYDKETGTGYRFIKDGDSYKWLELADNAVSEALAIANAAQDTADSKRRIFIDEPKPPYDNGDIWIKVTGSDSGEIHRCQISKPETGAYEEHDFIKVTQYTDGTVANKVDGELTVLKGSVLKIKEDTNKFTVSVEKGDQPTKSFMEYTSDGLDIGYKQGDVWQGGRAHIGTNEYSILDEGGAVLASFDDDEIWLGNETTRASVHLCGDVGRIYAGDYSGIERLGLSAESIRVHTESEGAEVFVGYAHVDSGNPKGIVYLNASQDTLGGSLSVTPNYVLAITPLFETTYDGETMQFGGGYLKLSTPLMFTENNLAIYAKNTKGADRRLIVLNGNDELYIGYDGMANQDHNTFVCGGERVNLYVPNINSSGVTGVRLEISDSTASCSFKPVINAGALLGSTSLRWYRLYQSESSVSTSDRREKENIKALKDIKKQRKKNGKEEEFDVYTELFDRLEPVEYNFIEGNKRKDFGLIAQDVLQVMLDLGLEEDELDLVHHDKWIDEETGEEKDSYGIAYENLIAVLIHEVQKLKATVKYK